MRRTTTIAANAATPNPAPKPLVGPNGDPEEPLVDDDLLDDLLAGAPDEVFVPEVLPGAFPDAVVDGMVTGSGPFACNAAQLVKFLPPRNVPTVIASARCSMCKISPVSVALVPQ